MSLPPHVLATADQEIASLGAEVDTLIAAYRKVTADGHDRSIAVAALIGGFSIGGNPSKVAALLAVTIGRLAEVGDVR